MRTMIMYVLLLVTMLFALGCAEEETTPAPEKPEETEGVAADEATTKEEPKTQEENKETEDPDTSQETTKKEKETTNETENPDEETQPSSTEANKDLFSGYERIDVEGGDQSGDRASRVVVDIGYGDRDYWAFTNEHGQLVKVVAEEIVPQDDASEPVLSNGRYFWDEAKVPGVESDTLDEGHVIADSLGGVSNAYNITPQESTLNRHGDQAYLEDAIRNAGGATDFEAIITYPDTETQIPSKYQYTYTIQGNEVVDTFDNVNPDDVNESLGLTKDDDSSESSPSSDATSTVEEEDVSSVDANGNGQVTIQEAKDAGFSMPITSDHWLYEYMRDSDGDGTVGE